MDSQPQQPALTPNTSAFLSYLASTYDSSANQNGANALNGNIDPRILPSSSYFNLPVPGRDTPQDTPSSKDDSVSPPGQNGVATAPVSDDSDDENTGRRGSGGVSKRKASRSQANHLHEEDDDDSTSDSPDAHEDKKHEAKKGGRKSKGGVDENGNPVKEMTKAQRRKEQNRQAQKNFRERREAKVRDLETKVAELESKSYGVNVENENLRGILKRLQEENVALKQAAFTFSMPVTNGSQAGGNGTRGPSPAPADDTLRSINEVPARQGSMNSKGTPDSLHSINSPVQAQPNGSSPQPPQLFAANGANAFDLSFLASQGMAGPTISPVGQKNTPPSVPNPSNSGFTPESSGSSSTKTEIEALWASFLDQQAQQRQQQVQPKTPGTLLKENAYSMFNNNGATNANPFSMSPKANGNAPSFDKMAFRDDSSSSKQQAAQAPPLVPTPQANKQDPWAGMNDDSMRDFLASLSGNNEPQEAAAANPPDDEDFNAQLLKLLGAASPSAAFNLPVGTDNPFSPTNYLNMENSPVSNPLSPSSQAIPSSASNSASPESSAEDAGTSTTSLVPSQGVECQKGVTADGKEWVYIMDQSGNMIKPEDMWNDLGFRKQDAVHQLLVDDLCDLMKTKVNCKDGVRYLSEDNAKHVLELRKEYLEMQRHQGGAP